MGLGGRHGHRRAGRTGRARRRRRAHRTHHHQHHHHNHHHNRANRAHVHHSQMNLFLGAMARGRMQASQNTHYNTNCQSSNTNTFVGFYASSSSTSAPTNVPPPSPVRLQYYSMCRVFSIFLWFVGIMMMSLGGFRTPIGFIGLGLLFLGIVFLVLTSLVMSGSCSNYCYGTSDPEQAQTRAGTRTERTNLANTGGSSGFTPPFATPYNDPSPAYASPDPSMDKPPSYEEVMAGRHPPTVSATVLPTIPEGDAPLPEPPPAELPVSEPSVPPYPSNTLQAQNLGRSVAEPYPPNPSNTETFQLGSGTNYSLDMLYQSAPVEGPVVPPQDSRVHSALELEPSLSEYDQSDSANMQTVQTAEERSADSVETHVDPSTQSLASAVTTPLSTGTPSEDSMPSVQVETLHDSPVPSTDLQTGYPAVDQPMHLIQDDPAQMLSSQVMVQPCALGETVERTDCEAGVSGDGRPSSSNSDYPSMSNCGPVGILTQSEC